MRWQSSRSIQAPSDRVFRTVADPEEFQKAIPGGSSVEYLTPNHDGVGAKFRATRVTNGKAAAFDQEVTEFVPGKRVRLVNVTHGTVWDSVFEVRPAGSTTELSLTMDARPGHLLGRIMNRLIAGMVQRALDQDLDSVKAHCEK